MAKLKKVTKSQYLQIVGLLALAKIGNLHITSIEKAIADIIGKSPESATSKYYGHVSDVVYSDDPEASDLLSREGIDLPEKII